MPVVEQLLQLAAERAQNGCFGSKMSHDHRAHLDAHLKHALEGYRSLEDVLPHHRWIFMSRRDVVAQALSLYVAELTDHWHRPTEAAERRLDEVRYDFFDILSKVMILGANNVNWEAYFAASGIQPHRVVYEDLVTDPGRELGAILRFLGMEHDAGAVVLEREGGLRAMSSASREGYARLKERFLEDFIRIGQPDDPERLGPGLAKWNAFFFGKEWRR